MFKPPAVALPRALAAFKSGVSMGIYTTSDTNAVVGSRSKLISKAGLLPMPWLVVLTSKATSDRA